MSKRFNISGPCIPERHYMLPPLARIPDAMDLVQEELYFVVHAPRQSGKTTSMIALCNQLNRLGKCYAVYCSLESAAVGSDTHDVIMDITNRIWLQTRNLLAEKGLPDIRPDASLPQMALLLYLNGLCRQLDKPLVLLLDEVDAVQGDSLLSLLRQLREGYIQRAQGQPFPASLALVGMRNIRDYRAKVRPDSETLGSASPFNIAAKYLTLGVFTESQIGELYAQHTAETGQAFAPEAVARAHYWTDGQPWLVNAIARECVDELCKDESARAISAEMVDKAAHAIILRREVHIDSLQARLREPAVRRVIEPAIVGDSFLEARQRFPHFDSDLSLVLDLGLLKFDSRKRLVPANRMYAEVFLRELSIGYQEHCREMIPEPTWVREDGLDMDGLLKGFQAFWRENSEMYTRGERDYPEALPHLVLMGFLQRVINGGGRVVREWAVGSGRLDLLVEFRKGRYPVELKIKGHGRRDGWIDQLLDYMDGLGADEGWLVTFDRAPERTWEERLTWEDVAREGKTIHLVGA